MNKSNPDIWAAMNDEDDIEETTGHRTVTNHGQASVPTTDYVRKLEDRVNKLERKVSEQEKMMRQIARRLQISQTNTHTIGKKIKDLQTDLETTVVKKRDDHE